MPVEEQRRDAEFINGPLEHEIVRTSMAIIVRNTRPPDFDAIERISRITYPDDFPWTAEYLATHLEVFPEGQFVAVDTDTREVVGMAASLIINWDDYDRLDSYDEFTDEGWFANHDPFGRTLYGAEMIVDPVRRGEGIGSLIYDARKDFVRSKGLLRIRAGARLAHYSLNAAEMSAKDYVRKVIAGEIFDPTLSFQLKRGFRVLAVVSDYFAHDRRSRGYAAVIEWINDEVITAEERKRIRTFE